MRIFLTIGTQAPFDRLVKLVDNWVEDKSQVEVFGQIGEAKYYPKNFPFKSNLQEEEFNELFEQCDLVVSHAGMGTIISACIMGKPIIVLPRLMCNKEHRNNHQLNTVEGMVKGGYIYPCYNESDFLRLLTGYSQLTPLRRISNYSDGDLVRYLTDLIG